MTQYIMVNGHKAVIAKGSKEHHGRKMAVWHEKHNGKWETHTTNLARAKYEKKTGKTLSKDTDVDHKDNNSKHDGTGNLQAMSHSKNVAKENKHRVGRQFE
jgi:hypothetical protein